MAQLQCPHCGGFKVDALKTESIGEDTREPISKGILFILFFPVMVIAISLMIAFAIMVVTIPLAIILYNAMDAIGKWARGYIEHAKKYQLQCNLCGYGWTWQTDEPYPEIQLRPDLIAKGDKRLEEERREREDAAGAHYLWQQQHKK